MNRITTTLWNMDPHTEEKHIILKRYLDAWFPIQTKYNQRVVIIDGFAGPGEYVGGKLGSPIIAIESVLKHKIPITSEIIFIFVEKLKDRFDFLQQKLKNLQLKTNTKCFCEHGEFAHVVNKILDDLSKTNSRLAPTFTFIDPFGFSGIPLKIIKRIMENKKCEVLITFMYEELNRFISLPENKENCNQLFESEEWQEIKNEKDPDKREIKLHQLYRHQLENYANIKFVRSFKMINKSNKPDYFLFFGTNNITGLDKMKEAMWKADPNGKFQFSDATYNPKQALLFSPTPNYNLLKKQILEKFKGKKVTTEELREFVIVDTSFLTSHYKSSILKPMEEKG